ncbi:MAG TPA: HAD-IA family hydrolase [Candidatus Polarisedimenticolaceae bacterium]|nr:HAD-IA family hydrolase [Candidatus Polarisedimenticolaceae bacterium]
MPGPRARYPVVLLDVGGTIVGPETSFGSIYASVLSGLGLTVDDAEIERSIHETWREMNRVIPPGSDRYRHFPGGEDEYWLRFTRATLTHALGRPPVDGVAAPALAGIRRAFLEPGAWRVFADVRPALARLRAAGIRLAVVSNWDSNLPRVLGMLGLAPYFEAVVISHVEGVEKPHPELFRRALARIGATADQALHVGDVPELDLAGAAAAGIDAVLVDRHRRFDATLRPIPDLSALPRIVRHGLAREPRG